MARALTEAERKAASLKAAQERVALYLREAFVHIDSENLAAAYALIKAASDGYDEIAFIKKAGGSRSATRFTRLSTLTSRLSSIVASPRAVTEHQWFRHSVAKTKSEILELHNFYASPKQRLASILRKGA